MGSLGAVIAIFSGVVFNSEKMFGKSLLVSPSSLLSLYHLVLTLVGVLLTFSPMHFRVQCNAKKNSGLSRFISFLEFSVIYWFRNNFNFFLTPFLFISVISEYGGG